MTERILTDYFLVAGASYRHSEQWQRTFERSDLPPDRTKPRAQVLRSGRFGVGALAAFLLGDKIEVETRHITSSVGFRFEMYLTQESVEIERVDDLPVGTCIRAQVTPAAYDKLGKERSTVASPCLWDWYTLNEPSVVRVRGNEKQRMERGPVVNLATWHKAETTLPLMLHWSFNDVGPRLSCNGIFVSNSAKLPEICPLHCASE